MSSRRVPFATGFACTVLAAGCAEAPAPAPARADYTEQIRGSAVEFDMVWIAEGGFWIGRTEVTWDEYLLFCNFEDQGVPPDVDAVSRPSKPLDDVTPYDRYWGLGRRPAVGMSWNAAQQFCKWLSMNTGHTYRLPSEAEWELACGESAQAPLADYAWFGVNSEQMTHEVGGKRPNEFGLHDVLGNLWEYCRDPFDPSDPERAVLRGGSWFEAASEVTRSSRLGFDSDWVLADPNVPPGVWWVPDGEHLGFRVLRSGSDPGP